ncbi:MAG: DMT family transporter [Paracoccaceae bacterium]
MGKDNVWLAIALSLLALTLFDAMGLVIKLLSPRYSAAELTAWRNLFGLIPSLLALWFSSGWQQQGRPIRMRQWKLALSRGMIVVLAQLCFYTSLSVLAFATASALSYANALFMTALAVPLLGERVGAVRWSAVLVGFVGVVLIMQPGSDSFSIHALLPVGAALFYALMGVSARMIDDDVPTPLLNLYSNVASSVSAFVMALSFGGFTPLHSLTDFAWIAAMGGFGGVAVLCLVVAFRMTEQSNLAPFSYFGIPIAFVLGWIFFDEAPWSDLFPGALLIIVGGLLIVWRERGKARS